MFGATPWQRFRRVTLPLLRPSIQTALILRSVLAFETFAVVLAIGGRNWTRTPAVRPAVVRVLHRWWAGPGPRFGGRVTSCSMSCRIYRVYGMP